MYKILIPIDGSELSLDALRHGLQLVRQGLRASFVLANVQEPASLYEIVTARDPDILHDVAEGAGTHLLEAAQALCEDAGVQHESEIASGEPANVLIDIIERFGCDAVIIGAGSEGSLSAALLGSVSQAVAHASPVPVTLVKHAQPQDDL
jgi:nucleotide-binding universal stress UspA family protein